ncbi:hypothetical protein N9850_13235 [Granulosicoccus sp.]|nr:hypothetical protein [Granulosicoccus sp.]MDB4224730.1 hypothetical protein [Granulosicoccus sp.]
MSASRFSDEQLIAYIDGQLAPDEVEYIQAVLQNDKTLRTQLDELSVDLSALPDAFAKIQPKKALVVPPANELTHKSPKLHLLVASVVCALIASFVAGPQFKSSTPDWRGSVAAYQALYSSQTLAYVETTDWEKERQLQRVEAAIGKKLSIAELSVLPEVSFVRAQLLQFEGKTLAQISLQTITGTPIAFCILPQDSSKSKEPTATTAEGLSAAYWDDPAYGYFLIGGIDEQLIKRLAAVYANLKV